MLNFISQHELGRGALPLQGYLEDGAGILKMAGLWAQGVCACTGTHVFMCTTRIVEALRIEWHSWGHGAD